MDGVHMKVPKFLNIFGAKIKLIVCDLGFGIAGQYEPAKKVITISPNHETDNEFIHSVLHECGHALFYRVSINQAVSYETHEFIVNNYATMLLENFDVKLKVKK